MKHDKGIDELTDRYLDLYRYAFSMLKNKADAEDVLHDAIAVTLSHRNLNNPYGYCIRTIKIMCVGLLRKKGSMIEISENISDRCEGDEDMYQKLMVLIEGLDKRERMLVEMHDMQGLSIREIAVKTKISESNIKKILIKVHKKLRKKCYGK